MVQSFKLLVVKLASWILQYHLQCLLFCFPCTISLMHRGRELTMAHVLGLLEAMLGDHGRVYDTWFCPCLALTTESV